MVGGHHIHIQNKTMKPLSTALSGTGREMWGEVGGGGWSNQCMYLELSQWISLVQQMYHNKNGKNKKSYYASTIIKQLIW
jgi:hypothetical protein